MRAGTLHTRIPEGEHGAARVVHDTPDEFTRLRAQFSGMPLYAEKYTRLLIGNTLWMTDAEFECHSNAGFVVSAHGEVLIAGLGLGLILQPLIDSPKVDSITVVERSADVIALISPYYPSPKLAIVEADVHLWTPPKKAFDVIYFDIWPDVPNSDNREEITTLKKRYRAGLKKAGRSFAWCEERTRR